MEEQLTIRLPRELRDALDEAAKRMDRKSAEIVRMALRAFLETAPPSSERPAARVRGLIGSVTSGVPDLAERHREYVLQSIRRGG